MSNFDSKALASAREVMALVRQEHIGGDAQLLAKIQCLFIEAMEYAAPQSFGNSEQLVPVSQTYTLRDGLAAIRKLGPIDAEKIQAERDALNSPAVPDGFITAINRLLDSDGSRGCFSAIQCYDAHAEIERLLAAAPKQESEQ